MGPVNVLENVALAVLGCELESQRGVVALQDSGVVIEHGEFTACIAQEGVGPSWVIHVMHCGGDQCCHLIQLIKASLGPRGGKVEHYPLDVRDLHSCLTLRRDRIIRIFS